MQRLIDANSAKASLLVVADCMTVDCDWLNGYKTGLLAATEAIDEIPTIEVPQWIPVTERLPEPFVSVLVQMPGERPFPTVREGFITKDGIWHSALYNREPDEVTHWMPMPKPPEDGGAENETE